MKCVFSDFGLEIFKEKKRYFLRFDAGEIVIIMKNVEVSPSEAEYIMHEKDVKKIGKYLIDNKIYDRPAVLFEGKLNCVEKNIIRVFGRFLEIKGYTKKEDEYEFLYTSPDIRIYVGGEPNSKGGDIVLVFAIGGVYTLSWIVFEREGMQIEREKRISTLVKLLNYLKRNYDLISNVQYCKETWNLLNRRSNRGDL